MLYNQISTVPEFSKSNVYLAVEIDKYQEWKQSYSNNGK
jgi:hypothetical protein